MGRMRKALRRLIAGGKTAQEARKKATARKADKKALRAFAAEFRVNTVNVPLVRIGGEGDGGYLLPDDLKGIRNCFSPGVSTTADFEEHVARTYGIKSFLADASVEGPPVENPFFEFDRKFLGAHRDETFTTLGAWVEEKLGRDDDHDLLLQMDIEGGEFDVLIESDKSLLRRFRIMVIEFHRMERIFEHNSLPLLRPLFAKLHQDFAIAHLHANNFCGIVESRSVGVPPVLEITYLRRDRVATLATDAPMILPHALDRPNVPSEPDIIMPDLWWRKM